MALRSKLSSTRPSGRLVSSAMRSGSPDFPPAPLMVADGTAYSSSRHRTKLVVRRQVPISSSPDVLPPLPASTIGPRRRRKATAILQPSSRNVRVVVAVRPSSERAIRCTDPVADSVQATSAAPASARKRNRGLNRLTLLHHVDLPADGDRVDRGQRRLREHQRQRLFAGGRRARPTATARGREEARLPTAGGNPARQLSLQPVATGVAHGGDDMDRKHF